jgi:pimeloyl-ACP methyl ester carboxylesterase
MRILFRGPGTRSRPVPRQEPNRIESMENIQEYCAEGCTWREEMKAVSERVSLRTITFEPANPPSNPPVVFVAGWITLMAAWKDVLREMTRDFTVYYIETREKISSKVTGKEPYTVEALGRDLDGMIAMLGLNDGRYVLFGSSLGATVVLDCVRFLRKQPKCLVVVGPNAEFRVPWWGRIIIVLFYPPTYSLLKGFIKWYLRNFRLDVNSDLAQYEKYCNNLDAADPWKLKKAAWAFSFYTVWSLLPAIRLPVLLVTASKDKLHEPENLKKMAALIPNCTVLDFETNRGTHSGEMVQGMREYLARL